MSRSRIGIDLSSTRIFATEVSAVKGGTPRVTKVGTLELPDNAAKDSEVVDLAEVSQALRTLWTAQSFRLKKISAAVGNQRVLVREHSLPVMSAQHLRSALPYQVSDLLPVPVSETILDFYPIEQTDGHPPEMRGLLVAVMKETAETFQAAVSDAGLSLQELDLSPFAIVRAVDAATDLAGTHTVVAVGDHTSFMVVCRDGVPQFVRIVPVGSRTFTEAMSSESSISFAAAETQQFATGLSAADPAGSNEAAQALMNATISFAGSIRSTNNYFTANSGSEAVSDVVLLGRVTQIPNFISAVGVHLDMPIREIDFGSAFVFDDPVHSALAREYATEFAVSYGLSLGVK